MTPYDIKTGHLGTDLDTLFDNEGNKIDVYSSVYWTAESEKEYTRKETIINEWSYEDDLVKAYAWCDVSGYDYWVVREKDTNYVSIDIVLKKNVNDYSQEDLIKIREIIINADEYFQTELIP